MDRTAECQNDSLKLDGNMDDEFALSMIHAWGFLFTKGGRVSETDFRKQITCKSVKRGRGGHDLRK